MQLGNGKKSSLVWKRNKGVRRAGCCEGGCYTDYIYGKLVTNTTTCTFFSRFHVCLMLRGRPCTYIYLFIYIVSQSKKKTQKNTGVLSCSAYL